MKTDNFGFFDLFYIKGFGLYTLAVWDYQRSGNFKLLGIYDCTRFSDKLLEEKDLGITKEQLKVYFYECQKSYNLKIECYYIGHTNITKYLLYEQIISIINNKSKSILYLSHSNVHVRNFASNSLKNKLLNIF